LLNRLVEKIFRKVRAKRRVLSKYLETIGRNEFCGIYFNWTLPPRRWDTMSRVHWYYSKGLHSKNRLLSILATLAWPFFSICLAWQKTRKYGAEVKRKSGVSLSRQFLGQIWLANRYYVPPRAYYFYGLYHPANRKKVSAYIQDYEIMPLLNMLNGSIDYEFFDDKLKFFEQCNHLGLRTVPIIAQFQKERTFFMNGDALHDEDLFAKPQNGKCGQGAELYVYEKSGRYRSHRGDVVDQKDLIGHIIACSNNKPYILQKRIYNHRAIAELTQGTLSTSRIITCIDLSGKVHILACIFKMATRETCTDNFATGGIAIPIDPATGALGTGVTKANPIERISTHPDTGRPFTGFRIPCWDQVIRLCRRAHEAFPAYAFIGWDVAVDDDGPMLVEGNLQFGIESIQMAHESPLGQPLFGDQYLAHMNHKRAAEFL